ncbi:uncharacterized protein LOC128206110 isoform X2 [Mya arenaria]|uniref:uncharacterized protein LOC128206110 isoform X2 n=1 Tax=Mya arenaria TaxID=6604 RepID=UPI0022E82B10|nr:uncharacterized protein LOC128206110 isoform X2 [Mya arenaria]
MDLIGCCDVCGEAHSTERCPELGLDTAIIHLDQLSTRARLTLPPFLEVVDNGLGLVGVVAKDIIYNKTQLGPFEAKRTTHIFDDTGFFTLKLITSDGTTVCLDTTDENECNWLSLVRAADSSEVQNCIAYQLGSNIFYNTTRDIDVGEELLVWYAPHLARKLGKPREPDGVSRVLLGHRIEPLTSELLVDEDEVETEEMQTDGQGDEEQEVGSLPPGEITKGFYCPRCGNTFASQSGMVQHLRSHVKNTIVEEKIGTRRPGRPRKHPRPETRGSHVSKPGDLQSSDPGTEGELRVKKTAGNYIKKHRTPESPTLSSTHAVRNQSSSGIKVTVQINKGGDNEYSPQKEIEVGSRSQPRRSTRGKHSKFDSDYIYTGSIKRERQNSDDEFEEVDEKDDDIESEKHGSVLENDQREKRGRGRPKKIKLEGNGEFQAKDKGTEGNKEGKLTEQMVSQSLKALKDNGGKKRDKVTVVITFPRDSDTDKALEGVKDHKNIGKVDEVEQDGVTVSNVVFVNGETVQLESTGIDPASVERGLVVDEKNTGNLYREMVAEADVLVDDSGKVHAEDTVVGYTKVENELDHGSSNAETAADNLEQVFSAVSVSNEAAESLENKNNTYQDTFLSHLNDEGHSSVSDNDQSTKGENLGNAETDEVITSAVEDESGKDQSEWSSSQNEVQIESEMEGSVNVIESGPVKEKPQMEDKGSMVVMFEETEDGKYGCVLCYETFDEEIHAIEHFTAHSENDKGFCKNCRAEFDSLPVLLEHRKSCITLEISTSKQRKNGISSIEKKNGNKFECDVCQQSFQTAAYLYRHMVIHTDMFVCNKCKKTFSRKDSLQKHVLKCCLELAHEYEMLYCEVCHRVFSKEGGLERHKAKCKSKACEKCDRIFATADDLEVHQCQTNANNEELGRYSCGQCGKCFQSMYYLQLHRQMHVNQHTCEKCGRNLPSQEELEYHRLLCETLGLIRLYGMGRCSICNQQFVTARAFREHHLIHTHPHQCETCQKRFTGESQLTNHDCPGVTNQLQCEACSRTFKSLTVYNKHVQEGECMNYQCSGCGEKFHLMVQARRHLETCTGENIDPENHPILQKISDAVTFICQQCGKSFSTQSNLTKHIFLHGDKKYECPHCEKRFHLEVYLKEHISGVHYNIYKFQCNDCGRLFKSRTGLAVHTNLFHSKDATLFACKECGKQFKQKGNLRNHMHAHSKERTYSCELCVRSFKFPDQLSRHKHDHKPFQKFNCMHCARKFKMMGDLRRHMQSHHSGMVYVCALCSTKCNHKHTLIRHFKRKHPSDTDLLLDKDYVANMQKHVREVYDANESKKGVGNVDESLVEDENVTEVTTATEQVVSGTEMFPQEAAEALQCLALGTATSAHLQILKDKGLIYDDQDGTGAGTELIVPQDSYILPHQESAVQISHDTHNEGTVNITQEALDGVLKNDGTININGFPQTIEGPDGQVFILQIVDQDNAGQGEEIQGYMEQVKGEIIELERVALPVSSASDIRNVVSGVLQENMVAAGGEILVVSETGEVIQHVGEVIQSSVEDIQTSGANFQQVIGQSHLRSGPDLIAEVIETPNELHIDREEIIQEGQLIESGEIIQNPETATEEVTGQVIQVSGEVIQHQDADSRVTTGQVIQVSGEVMEHYAELGADGNTVYITTEGAEEGQLEGYIEKSGDQGLQVHVLHQD